MVLFHESPDRSLVVRGELSEKVCWCWLHCCISNPLAKVDHPMDCWVLYVVCRDGWVVSWVGTCVQWCKPIIMAVWTWGSVWLDVRVLSMLDR
jgi:hypothetical protein